MEYVDLGLPSGKKWAKCNLGATIEEEDGLFFQFGDTVGYTKDEVGVLKQFSLNEIDYESESNDKKELDLEDDAAHSMLGDNWKIPGMADWKELFDNTKHSEWCLNGKYGIAFINKNDATKYIFIPYVSFAENGKVEESYGRLFYWSSSIANQYDVWFVINDFYDYTICYIELSQKHYGHKIRPIYVEE